MCWEVLEREEATGWAPRLVSGLMSPHLTLRILQAAWNPQPGKVNRGIPHLELQWERRGQYAWQPQGSVRAATDGGSRGDGSDERGHDVVVVMVVAMLTAVGMMGRRGGGPKAPWWS